MPQPIDFESAAREAADLYAPQREAAKASAINTVADKYDVDPDVLEDWLDVHADSHDIEWV